MMMMSPKSQHQHQQQHHHHSLPSLQQAATNKTMMVNHPNNSIIQNMGKNGWLSKNDKKSASTFGGCGCGSFSRRIWIHVSFFILCCMVVLRQMYLTRTVMMMTTIRLPQQHPTTAPPPATTMTTTTATSSLDVVTTAAGNTVTSTPNTTTTNNTTAAIIMSNNPLVVIAKGNTTTSTTAAQMTTNQQKNEKVLLQGKMSFVMPILCREMEYAKLTLATMSIYIQDIHQIWLIPDAYQVDCIKAGLLGINNRDNLPLLPQYIRDKIKILPAELLMKHLLRDEGIGSWGFGYGLQQLIKLAIAETYIETEYYVTLDADVVFLNEMNYTSFVPTPTSKAITNMEPTRWHPSWWKGSSKILKLDPPKTNEPVMGVTPVILHTRTCQKLGLYLHDHVFFDASNNNQHWTVGLQQTHSPIWSEYTLYYVFSNHYGMFDKYHDRNSSRTLYGKSIWFKENLADFDWNLAKSSSYCIVTQIKKMGGLEVLGPLLKTILPQSMHPYLQSKR